MFGVSIIALLMLSARLFVGLAGAAIVYLTIRALFFPSGKNTSGN
jgi:hypothetical protein